MPVPSSYNDVTQDSDIRDHIGWAWYHRDFFVPRTWKSQRVNIRFGSVNYFAIVVSADQDRFMTSSPFYFQVSHITVFDSGSMGLK
jgi:beta-glucuronidase